jgi:3-hydroxy-9,10-secoandrosta-1,3,5(10)-triene-9,17-dione monooxygenase reductase component
MDDSWIDPQGTVRTTPSAPQSTMGNTSKIDSRTFRHALGNYASGITIITGADEQGPAGFTCQSFYSVSTDPPLISFSVMKTSTTYPRILRTGSFAVNVLAHAQSPVSDQFARTGTDKWAGVEWRHTGAGNPALEGALLWLDCDIWAEHDAGDHLIVLGRVREISSLEQPSAGPLLYYKGRYRLLEAELEPTTENRT